MNYRTDMRVKDSKRSGLKEDTLRVAFLSHIDLNLYLFRCRLMKEVLARNCTVYAFVPRGRFSEELEKEGIVVVDYSVNRKSLNPFGALRTILSIAKLLKEHRIDLLHTFTFKPNVFGSIAGAWAQVPVIINHVTGLGFVYTENSFHARVLRLVSNLLYRIAFSCSSHAIFQNGDDISLLGRLGKQHKQSVIVSSGVNIEQFNPGRFSGEDKDRVRRALSIGKDTSIITIIARLNRHKGVKEFIEAAQKITTDRIDCVFLIVGWIDQGNPASFEASFIEQSASEMVRFLGERDDIPELLSVTDIYVLPSYREGTPRTVLEAMAMGKPVITTDVPGCRETIIHEESGILISPQDTAALTDALRVLLLDKKKREEMGNAARKRAVKKFSDTVVNNEILGLYAQLMGRQMLSHSS